MASISKIKIGTDVRDIYAVQLTNERKITLSGSVTGTGYFDGSGDLTITTSTNHTHNYAGSSSAGGGAKKNESYQVGSITTTYGDQWQVINQWITNDRLKIQVLNAGAVQNSYPVEVNHAYKLVDPSTDYTKTTALLNKGSATQPVYFSEGIPVACTYSVNATVPANAKFTDTVYTHPTTSGNKHIPAGGSSGQILRWSADGTAVWGNDNNTTYSVATESANGLLSKEDKIKLNNTNIAYGTCSTAAETAAKVVTLNGNTQWALKNGSLIMVKFANSNTASNVTLNVNGTGAYPIWYNNAAYTSTSSAYCGYKDRTITYMFNGTHWVWISSSYDANTQSNTNSTNTDSKIFIIGATSQGSNKTTYSHDTAYVGTDGCLYSNNTKVSVEGHTHNYAGSSSAGGAANSVKTNLIIKLNSGSTEGTNLFTFNGSTAKTINITPAAIGAAAASHGTHVSYGTTASAVNTVASAGTATTVSRSDHVHSLDKATVVAALGYTPPTSNTTYSAGTGLTLNGTTFNHSNSVTASTAKGSDTKTLTFGGTFALPTVSYDAQGHVTGNGTTTMTMPSDRLFVTLVPTGTSIPANVDLNTPTYMKVGRYFCSQTANAKTLQNCPVDVAFMMEVYSPLSTTIDNETTGTWVYRIRKITAYNTGMQFIQYASVGNTANTWTYGAWKVQPIANFTLDTSDKNGGSALTGSATKPIYLKADGTFAACTYSLNKDVPSDAKFTDTIYTHPTTSGNKHIPSGGSSGQILRWSADGTAVWGSDNNTTYSAGTGLTLDGTTFKVTSANVSTMMNLLGEGTSPAQQDDYLIAQYAGGGTTTTTYHRRKVSNIITADNVKKALGTGTGTTKYLREDGTWVAPPNSNSAHSHSAGVGLTGSGNAGTSGTYTYKINLVNETVASNAASYTAGGTSKFYAVQLDKNNKLGVYVPWTDNNTNYYHTPSYTSGLKIGTGSGIGDLYVPTGTTSSLGVVKQHTSNDCTSYTSDEGATTPKAVKKAFSLFGARNGVFYVAGNTTGTAGTWTGSNTDIPELFAGLTIAYKIGIAGGSSSTTLNLTTAAGASGAKTVYRNASTAITTQYPVNAIILLTYDGSTWKHADYNSNTTYSSMSIDEGTTGTATTSRVLTAANLKGIINAHAPTKTGTGASGTWGISISGNAATADKLNTSAGSSTKAIYFSNGKPVQCDVTIAHNITGYSASVSSKFSVDTSRYNQVITWYDSDGTTQHSYIGAHNTGNSTGAIIINPVQDSTKDNWSSDQGLYIGKTALKFWGSDIVTCEVVDTPPGVTTSTLYVAKSGDTMTGNLTAPKFIGALQGNADTATKANTLTTARTISLTGDVTGSVSFNGSQNVTLTATVADDSHNHTGYMAKNPGYIEMMPGSSAGHGGYIDFHYNSSSADYTSRIIESGSGTLTINGANITGGKVYGAVWNDYAEFRICKNEFKPGLVVLENGDDTLSIASQRLQRGCSIVSDTFGFAIGETNEAKCPIAVSGRVLAYGYESREEFKKHIGWPVCSGPNGTVSIMTEEEEEKYPSRIIGIISAVPDYEEWGTEKVKVNNRIWIKIK